MLKFTPYIFVIALFAALISPYLLTRGMFMDGVIYAAISKNLAFDEGSFWSLKFMTEYFNPFYEHPPLAIYFESLFFRLFGNQFWVERAYSVFTCVVSGVLIHYIWKQLAGRHKMEAASSWIPLLFWILFPLVSWSAVNNMLENTMAVFVLSSLLFLLNSLKQKSILFILLSGFSLSLAFLSKGPVALYLWSFFFLHFLLFRNGSFLQMVYKTLQLVFFTMMPFAMLYLFYSRGFDSLMAYLDNQVVKSVSSVVTVDSRFFILLSLLQQLILPFSVVLLWGGIAWMLTRKGVFLKHNLKQSLFFFLLGMTGVLPIMLSLKQSGFYILTTFPFFSISLALIIAGFPKIKVNSKSLISIAGISILLLAFAATNTMLKFGTYSRDYDKIQDLQSVKRAFPMEKGVDIDPALWQDWALFGYAARYNGLDFHRDTIPSQALFLVEANNIVKPKDGLYEKCTLSLIRYELYQKKR